MANAQATTIEMKDPAKNKALIVALLNSKIKMKIAKSGIRSIHLKGISFRQSNGHACDDPKNAYCGFEDPFSTNTSENVDEFLQLKSAIHATLGKELEKQGRVSGDCAMGSCFYDNWSTIDCHWEVIENKAVKTSCIGVTDVDGPIKH